MYIMTSYCFGSDLKSSQEQTKTNSREEENNFLIENVLLKYPNFFRVCCCCLARRRKRVGTDDGITNHISFPSGFNSDEIVLSIDQIDFPQSTPPHEK